MELLHTCAKPSICSSTDTVHVIHYTMVDLLPNPRNKQPTACLWRQVEAFLWHKFHPWFMFDLKSLQCCTPHCVTLVHVVTAPHYVLKSKITVHLYSVNQVVCLFTYYLPWILFVLNDFTCFSEMLWITSSHLWQTCPSRHSFAWLPAADRQMMNSEISFGSLLIWTCSWNISYAFQRIANLFWWFSII